MGSTQNSCMECIRKFQVKLFFRVKKIFKYKKTQKMPIRPYVAQPKNFALSLFPVAPTLEHRTSVKRFISLQFLNPKAIDSTACMGDQPVARPLPIQTQNQHRQASIP
jgi:hypothetical protein